MSACDMQPGDLGDRLCPLCNQSADAHAPEGRREKRSRALAAIAEMRDTNWGDTPRDLSLIGLRAMMLRLADEALAVNRTTPSPVPRPHVLLELAALCLMLAEDWQ